MNRTYCLIWNECTKTWVAVAETVKSKGKRVSGVKLLVASCMLLIAPGLTAQTRPTDPSQISARARPVEPTQLPTGGRVVAGSATISQQSSEMNINQSTNRAVIDWSTFNIGSKAQVNFFQPSASSVTLNRVLDPNPSQIFGQIKANGQVFLTNANGIYFAPGASVNVGALVATTHDISNADFMAGRALFSRNGATGSVDNAGDLTASLGGYIALLAPEVRNHGVIVAQLGSVAMAAGETLELKFDANNALSNVRVEPSTIQALVENGKAVQAPGGLIILSSQASNALQGGGIINNTGLLEASSLTAKGGRILLEGEHITLGANSALNASGRTGGGEVLVGGGWQGKGDMHQASSVDMERGATIDVSATKLGDGGTAVVWSDIRNTNSRTTVHGTILAKGGADGGDGGKIETSGHQVDSTGAVVTAAAPSGTGGLWLIDPADAIISQAIADSYTTTLNTGTSVTNTVAGNITTTGNVSIAKSAGGDATLTFEATGHISLVDAANYITGSNTTAAANGNTFAISSSSNKLHVVMNPGSGGAAGGFWLPIGSSISTNGGNVTIGGGAGAASNATGEEINSHENSAIKRGVTVNGTINAGGGNISLKGTGSFHATLGRRGISIGGTVQTSGSGTISLTGTANTTSDGVALGDSSVGINGTVSSENGAITVSGTKGSGNAINLSTATSLLRTTGTGNVTLTTNGPIAGTGSMSVGGVTTFDAGATEDITLTNTGSTLSGGVAITNARNVNIRNATALGLSGVNATGTIDIETVSGNLTVSGNVTTTNTTSSAIILNASNGTAPPSTGGGNIIISGSPTISTGAGGTARLYSGTVSGSTGLTGIIGSGSGKFRYASNQTTTNYTAALGTGVYAIYREQPTFSVTPSSASSMYGNAVSIASVTATPTSSYVNGDTTSTTTGTASFTTTATNGSHAGTYNIAYSGGLSNSLGYGFTDATGSTGEYSITARTLTATLTNSSATKPYDATTSAPNGFTPTYSISGLISGDTAANLSHTSISYNSANVANANKITVSGLTIGSIVGSNSSVAGDYTLDTTSKDIAASITAVPLTITASNASKAYGQTPVLTGFTSSGLLNGDTIGSVTETSSGTAASASVVGGPYAITPSNATGGNFVPGNYSISYVNGSLTVTPAALTVTASNASKAYGQTAVLTAFTSSGLLNGDTIGSVTETSSGTAASASIAGGPYAITASNASGGSFVPANYSISYVNGSLTVTPAALTVTASNVSKVFGQTPVLTGFTSSGLLNGDTIGSVTETSSGTAATASVVGGPYAITPSNATGGSFVPGNYTISYVNGSLTVTPAALTVTASNVSKVYGQTPVLTGFTSSGLLNGDTIGSVTETSSGTAATASVVGGPYAITPSNATGGSFVPGNYSISYVNGSLTVTPAALTVTASNASKVYGQTPVLSGFTSSGLLNGDTISSVTETSSGTAASASVAGGPYTITPSNASGDGFIPGNYSISYVNGSLTVTPAALTVTASNVSKVYGQTPVLTAFTSSGLFNGDTIGSVTETSSGTAASASVANGPYTITASNASGGSFVPGNYSISYVNGSLTVTPAALTVTANDASRVYDGLAFSGGNGVVYGNFVNGEDSSVLGGTLVYNGDSQGARTAGAYTLTPAGLTSTNYSISYVNGTLTITPLAPVSNTNNVPSTSVITTTSPTTGPVKSGLIEPVTGLVDPDLTPAPTTLATNDAPATQVSAGGISVNLERTPNSNEHGIITVSVPKAMSTSGKGFSFELPAQIASQATSGTQITVTTTSGDPLPSWLKFDPATKTFIASIVPDGSLPISVEITIGSTRTVIVISELNE